MKTSSVFFISIGSILGFIVVSVLVLYFALYRPMVVNENFFSPAKTDFVQAYPNDADTRKHVEFLTSLQPARNVDQLTSLNKAADYITMELKMLGFDVEEQKYPHKNNEYKNLIVKINSTNSDNANQIIVIGAHYDVCGDQPGADDNASGVAGLLELARLIKKNPSFKSEYNIHLVFYTLEEPPTYNTEFMGSFIHAKSLSEQKFEVKLMLSLEMIGYYNDAPASQTFPIAFLELDYPTVGNFIALVSDMGNRTLVRDVKEAMRNSTEIPVFSINAPKAVVGIDFSDHRSYWHFGYKNAMMLTDTSFYRNDNYHKPTDTADTLDYKRLGQVVAGVYGVLSLIK